MTAAVGNGKSINVLEVEQQLGVALAADGAEVVVQREADKGCGGSLKVHFMYVRVPSTGQTGWISFDHLRSE